MINYHLMTQKKHLQKETATEHYSHMKYKICVSGAAESGHCAPDAPEKAETLGRLIAEHGMILVTGATTGLPYWAARGAKEAGGIVIGLSPAPSKASHLYTYHLPIDYHDLIIYTGFDYAGRNLLLTRSADAIITICGRTGTLNEFTVGFEDRKPQGVLTGTGGIADSLEEIIKTEVTVRDKEDNMILKVCDEPIECKTSHQVVVTQKAHKLMVKVGAGLTDDNAFLRFLKVKGRDFVLFNTGMESSPIARIWINREEKTLVIDYFYNDGTVSIVKIDTTKKDFPYTVKTFDNIRDEK